MSEENDGSGGTLEDLLVSRTWDLRGRRIVWDDAPGFGGCGRTWRMACFGRKEIRNVLGACSLRCLFNIAERAGQCSSVVACLAPGITEAPWGP